jgi:N utilization substance protein B
MKNSFPLKRRLARQAAMQALYQQSINKQSVDILLKQFKLNSTYEKDSIDETYFTELLEGVLENQQTIDSYISRYINRSLSEIDIIELAITRIATFELLKKPEIPPKVILNEALELAKLFGGAEGHKFINGVCDKIAREIRHLEIKNQNRDR